MADPVGPTTDGPIVDEREDAVIPVDGQASDAGMDRDLDGRAASSTRLTKQHMSRLLYTNPACLLTTHDPATGRRNAMTITWLTATDNRGSFVASMNQARHSATIVEDTRRFVLSVPVAGMEELVLAVGGSHGPDENGVDKLTRLGIEVCRPGWRPLVDGDDDDENDGKSGDDEAGDSVGPPPQGESSGRPVWAPGKRKKAKKLTKAQRAAQEALAESDAADDLAVAACVAHMVCVVDRIEADAVDSHNLLFGRVTVAFVQDDYWVDGKLFAPVSADIPPYLTFFGSKAFGHVVVPAEQPAA